MASPNISAVTAAQGTGSIVKESVVEIAATFTADNNCNFALQLSLDNGSTWHDAIAHATANGLNVAAGTAKSIVLDVLATFAQAGFPSPGSFSQAKVRLTATDPIQSLSSSAVASAAFVLKSTRPVITSVTMNQYTGAAIAAVSPVTFVAQNGAGPGNDPDWFRANLSVNQLDAGSSLTFVDYDDGTVTFAFPGGADDGSKTVYFRVYDSFYNASDVASTTTWLQRAAPSNGIVRIIGSVDNSDYTGIAIAEDGSFTVDRSVRLVLRATSALPLTYKILPTSDVETHANINVVYDLDSEHAMPEVFLTTNASHPAADNFNTDANVSVSVQFTDAASNSVTIASTIRLNTRLYQAAHYPLKEPDATYQPMIREVTSGGAEVVLPSSMVIATDPIRLWHDIFHPSTHSFPTDGEGNVDETSAIAMAGVSTADNDAPLVSSGQLVVDDQDRPLISAWTNDGTKNYNHLTSANSSTLTYWVVNTTGHGAYRLEFEHFDVDANSYGPPFNAASKYRGDVLIVYDATTTGALQEVTDDFGETQLILGDSTLLKEMFAFTGSGTNVANLTTGQQVGSDPNGGFVSDWIRGIPKIALIFYSDAAKSASGFRLKASPKFDRTWRNYDIHYATGKIWIHKHSSLGSASGAADNTSKRAVYDYFDQNVSIDYDAGTVIFSTPPDPSGVGKRITADYSYHGWSVPPSNDWLLGQDDLVDYVESPLYLQGPGNPVPTNTEKNTKVFEIDGYGRFAGGFTVDKDRGLVTLDDDHLPTVDGSGVRLFSDFSYHTFKRLTNDGYGDLEWHDRIIVADVTPLYRDFTWTDVKIVNEGDAMLEDAKFKFVPRGYDTNNDGQVVLTGDSVVDQVLDINRPWDIQMGTKQETYDKMALEVNASYIWQRVQDKTGAQNILGTWKDHTFGDIPGRSRVFGRAAWVLGGSGGSNYPPTTPGPKRCSLEATGKFYAQIVT